MTVERLPGWRRWTVAIVAGTSAVMALAALTGMKPHLVLVAGLGAVVGITVWVAVSLRHLTVVPAVWATAPSHAAEDDSLGYLTSGWGLLPMGPDDWRGAARLHARLVELVDDRLATGHSVDRHHDPDTARAILGDDLSRFVDDPDAARSLTSEATVERVVARIEAL